MDRKLFLKSVVPLFTAGIISSNTMNLQELNTWTSLMDNTQKMPVLFLGHGNPMNAIEENEFVVGFRNIAKSIPTPNAILCISAHWETKGTFVTAMQMPRTIHDFGGFPKALFDVQYPAAGSPQLAKEVKSIITTTHIELDDKWGLDHGAWSVIKHLYPKANIPVIQLSLDYTKPAQYHYDLAREIRSLRQKGILIIGSGNMVHNLRMVAWDKLKEVGYGFEWATEASEKMKSFIKDKNHRQLIDFRSQGKAFDLAIHTPEHYLPLLYTLGLQEKNEDIKIFNDKALGASLTMTSLKIG